MASPTAGPAVIGGLSLIQGYRADKKKREAQKQQRRLEEQQLAQAEERARTQANIDETQRQDALRAGLAASRARMGASGITAGSGSFDAVLDGMRVKSEFDKYRNDLGLNWKLEDIMNSREMLGINLLRDSAQQKLTNARHIKEWAGLGAQAASNATTFLM